ncbi:bifunctional aspartate transaminase/aspartate 4-decarboxylase [Actinomadura harenae]|nr:bifunctional aspartate transaminase/aspartate 4-decarboxylase [Actinomadura harenae]
MSEDGTPDGLATEPRAAFLLLGRFALDESRHAWGERDGLGGRPRKDGIAARLTGFLDARRAEPGANLLSGSLDHAASELGLDADGFVHELANAVLGEDRPEPPRMLVHVEAVVRAHLVRTMFGGRPPERPFDLFATEGATAALCYLFDSLQVAGVLRRGDRVATTVPVSAPYLEFLRLDRYAFDVVGISAVRRDGLPSRRLDEAGLARLDDPDVKALHLAGPASAPPDPETLDRIVRTVRAANPGLIIVSDDASGTVAGGLPSLMSALPRNTVGVHSFSKRFGCSGWRLGVLCVNRDNIIDERIAALPDGRRRALDRRYASISPEPERLRFIDRLVADSRDVALARDAGLSTPQQAQMALFALQSLLDTGAINKRQYKDVPEKPLHAVTDEGDEEASA